MFAAPPAALEILDDGSLVARRLTRFRLRNRGDQQT
jgi:hypothetical protein